jgi:hypothetical protein
MTVQTLKLSGKPYVLVPENEFRKLVDRLARYDAEERSDAAIVRRRLKSKRPLIPLAQVKKELGL